MKYPLILSHIYKERVWGGSRLKKTDPPTGEDWVLSVRDDDNSIVENGAFKGKTLAEVLADHPEYLGDALNGENFPLLIKFIDSKESLSIQIHPDDELAARLGGEGGKSEMWYIIDAQPDSYIYFGMKPDTDVEELRRVMADGSDPTPYLAKVSVKAGDCFFIEGGTPHAIGGGIYLCEIQQNCDTTYRIYDYGRPRELHLREAALSLKPNNIVTTAKDNLLADCKYFKSELLVADAINAEPDRFVALTVINGEGSIAGYPVRRGDCVFIPAGEEKYPLCGHMEIIKTTP